MDQFEGDVQQYSMEKEAELQQKIQSLEGNMLQLFNKLLEEKQKLDQAMAKQYVPTVSSNIQSTIDSNPTNVEHLPRCPNSRMVLEIDPNCKLHGHVYSKNSETESANINAHSILSMYNLNSSLAKDSNYAGGDIDKVNNSINPTSLTVSGIQENNIGHLTNAMNYGDHQTVEDGSVNHVQISDNIPNNYYQFGPVTQANTTINEDVISQNQMSYTEKLKNLLNTTINNSDEDNSAEIPNEIPTYINSVMNQSAYNNLNTKSRVNICKILEISDYKNCLLNSSKLDNYLKELDGRGIKKGELAVLLKALNITQMNTDVEEKNDDTFVDLLQEIMSRNK